MGRAIPPAAKHESSKQARRRARYEALLDAVELATGIIATISDGVLSVPGLKSTVALVNQIVVVAKEVNVNRKDCDDLVERACDCLSVMAETLAARPAGFADNVFGVHLLAFRRELVHALGVVECLSTRRYWLWYLQYAADKRAIDDCKGRIDRAFERLILGHMIVCDRQLGSISHRVNVVSNGISDLTNLCQAQGAALQNALGSVHNSMRQDLIDLVFGLNDIRMQLPRIVNLNVRRLIHLLSPAKILWHPWALEDARRLQHVKDQFNGDVRAWVEAKAVSRILRDWMTASRVLVTGWDLRSPEVRYAHRVNFFIHVEFSDHIGPFAKQRYVQIEVRATDLEGWMGGTMCLDENGDVIRQEMDEQMGESHNFMPS
ncbi:hypothetical protein PHLGIDRAFT_130136 [Phlebiopsis gigantea 11061_1 CR5-6]|uniref:Uncharacterized protein n=1 Tax=Phlebiopsis gigantea (strain 11061_1 CR5-6) TaxID=745531 RepID=A0A0C3S5C7_PHLG1|nr:hypothetical protein PHLGIDRAFT_130136 [Phlebiopsis gigantea 11061_1 CR5-6]